jgi:hypothetical protein
MLLQGWNRRGCLAALFACFTLISTASAQAPAGQPQQPPPAGGPNYRVAERSDTINPAQMHLGEAGEHPLMPALRWAREGLPGIEKIHDYTATLIKRERIGANLGEHQCIAIKVRHKPFSVYLNFLAPADLKGQECMFIEGTNNGKMWAHGTGIKEKMFGTVSLNPDGNMAMAGQRYPLTQIGILNLTRRLIEVAETDVKYGECEVKYFKGAKINDRICTCTQVVHPLPRKNFLFNVARIFVDDNLNIPVRYEAYDWPKAAGGAPELIEEYTYLNMRLNVGLGDQDFDIENPIYHFRKVAR